MDAKARRYDLQRTAQTLLYDPTQSPSKQSRVCWCQRTVMTSGTIAVYRTERADNARLSGLNTCGSGWDCPVCGAKITEARRGQLAQEVAAWIKIHGGTIMLLTLTFPHESDHPLAELVEKQTKARQKFANCRTWKRIMKGAGYAGMVRSLETTVGPNGWHPHTHDLLYLNRNLVESEALELRNEWIAALGKVGLGGNQADMEAHSFDLRDGTYAAEYVAKYGRDSAWGMSSELTRSHAKIGRESIYNVQHKTPFQLLADHTESPGCILFMKGRTPDKQPTAAQLFQEFSAVFKGKRMLTYTRGLRALLVPMVRQLRVQNLEMKFPDRDVGDMDDKQLAALDEPMAGERKVGELDPQSLGIIIRTNKMGEFLQYVATCAETQQDLDDYITALDAAPKTHGGQYRIKNWMWRKGSPADRFVECY